MASALMASIRTAVRVTVGLKEVSVKSTLTTVLKMYVKTTENALIMLEASRVTVPICIQDNFVK